MNLGSGVKINDFEYEMNWKLFLFAIVFLESGVQDQSVPPDCAVNLSFLFA
jgi:hypothetical protein